MYLSIRYQYLLIGLCFVKPKSIIEVGLAKGVRAYQMIQLAMKYNASVSYCGYDVFDTKDQDWHKLVGNGKKVESKLKIEKRLKTLTSNVKLVEGMTKDTLWTSPNSADFVWLDGDHRLESIRKDFESLKNSKVIVFDDYYTTQEHNGFSIEDFGCNKIVEKLNHEEIFISPRTKKYPEIRVVFWSKDKNLIKSIKELLTDIKKVKKFFSI